MTGRKAYPTGPRLALQAATGLLASMFLACFSGCAPQVASVAATGAALSRASQSTAASPTAVPAARNVGEASGTTREAPDRQEQADRCTQLRAAQPGVEEVRLTRTGVIESREIRLDESQPHPQWVVYRHKNSSTDGWRSQSNIDRLHFVPPLRDMLPNDEARYLAYAATIADKPEDSEKMVSIAENFGSQAGTFEWQNRTYGYVLVKKLPCFPGPQ